MRALYLAFFILGLLLAVGVMLFGIERRAGRDHQVTAGGFRSSIPLLSAFCVGFGVSGYLLSASAGVAGSLAGALAIGAAAGLSSRWLVAKSAAMVPEHDVEDERYVLQGHVARVVSAIGAGAGGAGEGEADGQGSGEGEIAFEVGAVRRTLRARSVGGVPLDVGTEVVIERIELGVAFVEPWIQVEQRL
jgi:hypothetical protein